MSTENSSWDKFYDKKLKRNVWSLGYFGGGSVNIVRAMQIAEEYAKINNVPLESVLIDEVLFSSRYKGYKILFSLEKSKKEKGAFECDNVHEFLRM